MAQLLSDTKHISSLNLLRGLAAVSVACFHILASADFGNWHWLKTLFSYGYLGLDLFFIISGFVIPYSMYQNNYTVKKFPKFLLKRSVRIEPPYIISFLLIILMRIIHLAINNWQYEHDWKQFGLHFLYLNQYFGYEPYTVVYWTLAIEFQFYILIGVFYPVIVAAQKIFSFAFLALFCAVCWVLNLHYNWFIFQYGYMFVTGILIFMYVVRYISFKIFILLFAGLLALIYFKTGVDVFITAIFGAVSILSIKREWKLTNFLGKISYSFYLVHSEASGWFGLYTRDIITNEITRRLIGFGFAFAFAVGFYYLFERPAIKLSKKVGYQKEPVPNPTAL